MRVFRHIWMLIEEPRVRRVLWSVAYLLLTAGGIATLLNPPVSVEQAVGPFLAYLWGGMVTVGGAVGAWSTLTRWWVAERAAILLCWHGALIYLALTIYNHAAGGGNRLPQAAFIAFALVAFAIRFYDIRRFNKRPE